MFVHLLIALLPTSLAAIEALPPCDPDQGVPGGLYTCPSANFESSDEQPCNWYKPGTCVSWGGVPPRSIGPDPGGICAFYDEPNCAGDVLK
jgi:hypothetical protein